MLCFTLTAKTIITVLYFTLTAKIIITVLCFTLTAKINEDFGDVEGEDMITFDNNAEEFSSSEEDDNPHKKDDFDLDDIDDVSIVSG